MSGAGLELRLVVVYRSYALHGLCVGTVGYQEVTVFEKVAEPLGVGVLLKEVGHERWARKFHSMALFCIHTLLLYQGCN